MCANDSRSSTHGKVIQKLIMASNGYRNVPRISQLFWPRNYVPSEASKNEYVSNSYKHMIQNGVIRPLETGMHALLPMGVRAMEKLTKLVDAEMEKIGASKISLPALTSTKLWKKTKRYDSQKSELFKLSDRHDHEYLLGPTYEEAACDLILLCGPVALKSTPFKVYQISNKWRDEMKPRCGFLRSREFTMKDLYTFDADLDKARETYALVSSAYDNFFRQIGVKYLKVLGDSGSIGGIMSHEYHYLCDIGEDVILTCPSCDYSANSALIKDRDCPKCKKQLTKHDAFEVGHTFLLDTTYTKPLKVMYKNEQSELATLSMGCYGLGLSRIMSAAVEVLSTSEAMRWPEKIAPYTVCIITPKRGSKEEMATAYVDDIIEILSRLEMDVILDDRTEYTIGRRLAQGKTFGFPYIIVIGQKAIESTPTFEVHNVNECLRDDICLNDFERHFTETRKPKKRDVMDEARLRL